MEHGFSAADVESGRVGIGDAMLLDEDPKALDDALRFARDRLLKHLDIEEQRAEAGLETDFERYVNGKETRD